MAALVGFVLALAVAAYAAALRLDRDRTFYSVVLIVVASYWVLFAAMSGSTRVILLETSFAAVFVVAASIGFKRSLWLVAAGLAAHGVFDVFHAHLFVNPGMPEWWPAFCATYDVVAAAVLAGLLLRRARAITPRAASTSTETVA